MEKVKIESFNLIGITIRTTNKNGQAMKEIGELWGRFWSENILEKIPNKIDNNIYSVYTEYEGDHTKPYATILGCKVETLDQIPEGLVGKSFDGGNYVKTSTRGDIQKGIVAAKWREIWEAELDRIYTADFEVYGERAQNPNDAEIDFFISIE